MPFAGNHGVTALVPALWLPVAAVTTVGLLWVLVRRSEGAGLTWAVTAGLLIAPYAGTYSALPVALAVPGLLASAPTFTLAMVALSTIATGFALPFYALAVLLAGWQQAGPRVAGWFSSLTHPSALRRADELRASER